MERTDDLSTQNLWIVRERTQGLAISKFYAFLQFNRDAQKIIHEFKYNGRRRLAGEIIDHLSEEIVEIFATTTFDMIVPVPLHPKRIRERSYNQSELIAAEIAGLGSTSVDNTIVKRTRSTRSQTLLSASERHRNVSGAFEVNPDSKLEGKSVLLVDDLITTGATFNACALALSAAKADRVDALAIARA